MRSASHSHFSVAGFTLLEVMIAVAVIAITMVTLIGSQSQSISLVTEAQFEATAALLAQEKFSEIQVMDYEDVASGSGDFGENFASYRWSTEVQTLSEQETGIEGSDDLLKSVLLKVYLEAAQERSLQLQTLVLRPPLESTSDQ